MSADADGGFALDLTNYVELSAEAKAKADAAIAVQQAADIAEIERLDLEGPAEIMASLPTAVAEPPATTVAEAIPVSITDPTSSTILPAPTSFTGIAVIGDDGRWVDKGHLQGVSDAIERKRVDREARIALAVEDGDFGGFDPSKILSFNTLATLPPTDHLIDGLIERGTITMLFADGHVGKSFVALAWACCVASGSDWLGRPAKKGRVLYVAAEGRGTFSKRLAAWHRRYGSRFTDDAAETYPLTVNMMDPTSVASLAAYVKKGQYDLVILDTLSKVIVGANENGSEDMARFIANVVKVQEAHLPSAVVILHHSKKDDVEMYRGASVLYDGVDNVICMRRVMLGKDPAAIKDPHRRMIVQKLRNGLAGDVMHFVFEEVPGTDSSVLVEDLRAKLHPIVIHLLDMQKAWGGGPITRTDLKNSFAATGIPKDATSANAMMTPLLKSGALVLDPTTNGLSVGVIGGKP